jgi:hypothetical protein
MENQISLTVEKEGTVDVTNYTMLFTVSKIVKVRDNTAGTKGLVSYPHDITGETILYTVTELAAAIKIASDSVEISDTIISVDTINEATPGASISVGNYFKYLSGTTITAFATGGQASATALTKEFNDITTVATAGDSVKLPAAAAGLKITVKNSGAAALDIFPAASDSIDALAINLAVRIQPGSTATFYAKDAIVWESNIDETLTIISPTTNTGALVLKAVASAGNYTVTVKNASHAASREYTIPDEGAAGNFAISTIAQIASFYPQVAQNDIAAATGGAIVVTNYLTTINTDAGGDAFSLANGTKAGQMKKILLVADGGGDATITPATALAGGTTITMGDAGDYIILQWSGSAWVVIENSGSVIA